MKKVLVILFFLIIVSCSIASDENILEGEWLDKPLFDAWIEYGKPDSFLSEALFIEYYENELYMEIQGSRGWRIRKIIQLSESQDLLILESYIDSNYVGEIVVNYIDNDSFYFTAGEMNEVLLDEISQSWLVFSSENPYNRCELDD